MQLLRENKFISPSFVIEFITASELSKNIKFDTIKNFISINLNELLERIYKQKFNVNSRMKLLTEREAELLMMIRTQKYEEITIKMNNGKIRNFIMSKAENTNQQLAEIISKKEYQNIQIIVRNKKIERIISQERINK